MVFFADRIYQLRNEKGYTREELAAELGCMPRQIQDYEEASSTRTPSPWWIWRTSLTFRWTT